MREKVKIDVTDSGNSGTGGFQSGHLNKADILVVEDDIDELQLLKNVLTRAGYRIRPTRNGNEGMRAARILPPDIILLDVKLPDKNGFEVCRQLKADPLLRDIPVIFISGLSDAESHVQGFEVGGRDFITKPFQEIEVIVRIQNQLELVKLQRQQHIVGQLQERHRIARELHDSVSQTLFTLGSTAQSLTLTENDVIPDLADNLTFIHKLSQIALEEMRLLLFELGSDVLERTPITVLFTELIEMLRSRTDAEFVFKEHNKHLLLDQDALRKETIYRIVREAIFNSIKHANASHIQITIDESDQTGKLIVEDDGIGFDKSESVGNGSGLLNMRERASEAHIALDITSKSGSGTKIQATWMY